jgi:hypothetical protein
VLAAGATERALSAAIHSRAGAVPRAICGDISRDIEAIELASSRRARRD